SRKNAAQQAVATAPRAPAAGDNRPSSNAVAAPAATNGRPAECIGGSVSRVRSTRCRSVAGSRGDAMRSPRSSTGLSWLGLSWLGLSWLGPCWLRLSPSSVFAVAPYAATPVHHPPGEGHRE